MSGKGPHQERKVALRAELDSLRADQARLKGGRGKTLDQVKLMQDNVAKKVSARVLMLIAARRGLRLSRDRYT